VWKASIGSFLTSFTSPFLFPPIRPACYSAIAEVVAFPGRKNLCTRTRYSSSAIFEPSTLRYTPSPRLFPFQFFSALHSPPRDHPVRVTFLIVKQVLRVPPFPLKSPHSAWFPSLTPSCPFLSPHAPLPLQSARRRPYNFTGPPGRSKISVILFLPRLPLLANGGFLRRPLCCPYPPAPITPEPPPQPTPFLPQLSKSFLFPSFLFSLISCGVGFFFHRWLRRPSDEESGVRRWAARVQPAISSSSPFVTHFPFLSALPAHWMSFSSEKVSFDPASRLQVWTRVLSRVLRWKIVLQGFRTPSCLLADSLLFLERARDAFDRRTLADFPEVNAQTSLLAASSGRIPPFLQQLRSSFSG